MDFCKNIKNAILKFYQIIIPIWDFVFWGDGSFLKILEISSDFYMDIIFIIFFFFFLYFREVFHIWNLWAFSLAFTFLQNLNWVDALFFLLKGFGHGDEIFPSSFLLLMFSAGGFLVLMELSFFWSWEDLIFWVIWVFSSFYVRIIHGP